MRSKAIRFVAATGIILGLLFLGALLTSAVIGTEEAHAENKARAEKLAQANQALNGQNLIRFHVVANSDSERDQALKRKIRDLIVERVSPELSKAKTLAEARRIAEEHLGEMKSIAEDEIGNWGEDYPVTAQLGRFNFPVKTYGSLVLPAGNYEAVRVVIGKGQGANWWCVLFPPLCFVDVSRAMNTSDYQPADVPKVVDVSSVKAEGSAASAVDVYERTDVPSDTLPVVREPELEHGTGAGIRTADNLPQETSVKVRFKILEFFGWSFD